MDRCFLMALVLLAIFFPVNSSESESGGLCEYKSQAQQYVTCAEKHPTLTEVTHEKHKIAGLDIVNVFTGFCKAKNAIHACVKEFLDREECPESAKAKFISLAEISELFCDGPNVIPEIDAVYKDIEAVGGIHSDDHCMKRAIDRKHKCHVTILLSMLLEGIQSFLVKESRLIGDLPCTVKSFGDRECPLKQGILYTTIAHSSFIVPPMLGVNVTYGIMSMYHYQQQRYRDIVKGGGVVGDYDDDDDDHHDNADESTHGADDDDDDDHDDDDDDDHAKMSKPDVSVEEFNLLLGAIDSDDGDDDDDDDHHGHDDTTSTGTTQ